MRRALTVGLVCLGLASCTLVGAPGTQSGSAPVDRAPARPDRWPVAAPAAAVELPEALTRFSEVRGVWVVRSTLTTEARVREMVAAVEAAGVNTIIVQVRGRGDAYYASDIEPTSESLADQGEAGLDPLALAIEEAHARGIAVHAWVNTHLVWGPGAPPRSPEHIVNAHPDWLGVPRALGRELHDIDPFDPGFVEALRGYASANTGTVEGLYSSPSHPEVQERVYRVWTDLAERYPLDGIHFDYIRFPSGAFDYSAGALARFRGWTRSRIAPEEWDALDALAQEDPYAFVDALEGPWGDFRREQITGLVARIYRGVKQVRPDIVVSAAVFADPDDAYANRFQDWRGWLTDGILDVAVPMAYTADRERFRYLVREARASVAQRERVWAGIGAYVNTIDGTLGQIDIARGEGAGGLILFSYDWAASETGPDETRSYLDRVGSEAFNGR